MFLNNVIVGGCQRENDQIVPPRWRKTVKVQVVCPVSSDSSLTRDNHFNGPVGNSLADLKKENTRQRFRCGENRQGAACVESMSKTDVILHHTLVSQESIGFSRWSASNN